MSRLKKIAAALRAEGLDGALLTTGTNMLYATGCPGLEGAVLISADGRGWCMTDSRYTETAQAQLEPAGFTVLAPQGRNYPAAVGTLAGQLGIVTLGYDEGGMTVAAYNQYIQAGAARLEPASHVFSQLRAIKEEAEVESIVAAQRIAEQALEKLLPDIRPGRGEKELASLLDYYMNSLGSQGVSFSTIFVSGPNSSLPHGRPGPRKLENGDFVTIDFGAVVNGYHSDMTRTFVMGRADEQMKQIYSTVLEAQLAGIDALAAGKSGHDVHMAAADIISAAGFGQYFGHGLGHSLGLDIHENPRAAAGAQAAFEVGNIITVEPGIYIPGKGGVRIEDMVYLGSDGKQNLTRFPKELTVL